MWLENVGRIAKNFELGNSESAGFPSWVSLAPPLFPKAKRRPTPWRDHLSQVVQGPSTGPTSGNFHHEDPVAIIIEGPAQDFLTSGITLKPVRGVPVPKRKAGVERARTTKKGKKKGRYVRMRVPL